MTKSIIACLALLLAGTAHAATPVAYEFASAPVSSDTQLSLGFSFSTNAAITIESLGYYDHNGDGFATAHEVGLFNSAGTLLTSVTLNAGTSDSLNGHFRYKAITPFTLAAGESFVIAATTYGGSDVWAYGNANTTLAGFTTDPAINIGQNAALYTYQNDNVLRNPTSHFSNYTVYAGPNFTFSAAAVPEPASWVMAISGFGLIGGLLRRRTASAVTVPA